MFGMVGFLICPSLDWPRCVRAAFKDIINRSHPIEDHPDLIVNTHATFRWRHGLFSAFDFDQMQSLQPNMFVCLVDNIEMVHARLHKEHEIDATLKDCMVWREEEILATELLAQAMGCPNDFYILSRGRHNATYETCRRLVTRPEMRKVYPSFPMSHVVDMPDVLAEIAKFRAAWPSTSSRLIPLMWTRSCCWTVRLPPPKKAKTSWM